MTQDERRTSTKRKRRTPRPSDDDTASSESAPPPERPRRVLFGAAGVLIVGLALVGHSESELGKWVTLGGMIGCIYGIHTFGRLGPEPRARA